MSVEFANAILGLDYAILGLDSSANSKAIAYAILDLHSSADSKAIAYAILELHSSADSKASKHLWGCLQALPARPPPSAEGHQTHRSPPEPCGRVLRRSGGMFRHTPARRLQQDANCVKGRRTLLETSTAPSQQHSQVFPSGNPGLIIITRFIKTLYSRCPLPNNITNLTQRRTARNN